MTFNDGSMDLPYEPQDDPAHPELFFADAHVSTADTYEAALLDVCVRCHPYAYGPLCDRHRTEVTA